MSMCASPYRRIRFLRSGGAGATAEGAVRSGEDRGARAGGVRPIIMCGGARAARSPGAGPARQVVAEPRNRRPVASPAPRTGSRQITWRTQLLN